MACNPVDLLADAACLTCLDAAQQSNFGGALLCRLAEQGIPTGYPTQILGEGGEFILGEGGENILEQ
jgi:hypothetical protein